MDKEARQQIEELKNQVLVLTNDLNGIKEKELTINDIRWLSYGGREFISPAIKEDACYYIGDALRDGTVKICNDSGTTKFYQKTAGSWVEQVIGGTAKSYVFLAKSTNQTVGSSATDITFDIETSDTDGFHTGSNAYVTVPTGKAGKYIVVGNVDFDFDGVTGDYTSVFIYHNATAYKCYGKLDEYMDGSSNSIRTNFSLVLDLAVGDTVKLNINLGGDSTSAVNNTSTFFQLMQID